jgi:HipA-like protein
MKATVFYNHVLAGILERIEGEYSFEYDSLYLNSKNPPISFSLPKTKKNFNSKTLFPFFSGLLSEGINKEIQCKSLKIDEKDDFLRLLLTAHHDTIGAITIRAI